MPPRNQRRYTRRRRTTRQRGRGVRVNAAAAAAPTNFSVENPLLRQFASAPMQANTVRVPVTESVPVYATRGKAANGNTMRRRSLKNSAAHQPYVGINMNAASAASMNVVRNYKSPAQRSFAKMESAPSPVRYSSEFTTPLHKINPSASWLMHRTAQMPGSRHLQI